MILSENPGCSSVSVPLVDASLWLISRVQELELILTFSSFFYCFYGRAEFGVFYFAILADVIPTLLLLIFLSLYIWSVFLVNSLKLGPSFFFFKKYSLIVSAF